VGGTLCDGPGLSLSILRKQAQLRDFLPQLVALVFQLAQFIATDRDVKGLCWPCC
jgi:hypothetical protein